MASRITRPGSSREQNETVAGDLWTTKRDEEDWPIVICDEEIIDGFWKDRIRPTNARCADGTWKEEYKPGGLKVDQRCYPAVLLGKIKL